MGRLRWTALAWCWRKGAGMGVMDGEALDDDDLPPFDADSPGDGAGVAKALTRRQQANADGMQVALEHGVDLTLPAMEYPSGLNAAGKRIYAQIAEAWKRDPEEGRREFLGMAMPGALLSTMRAANGEPPFEKPQRWAVRAILEIGKIIGASNEIRVVMELAQEYGLKSEAELRQRLELATRVRDVSLETAQARATELLRRIIAADPGRRDAIRSELFGELEVQQHPTPRPVWTPDPTVCRQTDYRRRKRAGGPIAKRGRPPLYERGPDGKPDKTRPIDRRKS